MEKRKHKRIDKPYTVRLRLLKEEGSREWDMVFVKNISAGGMLFRYERAFPVGTILHFKVNFALDMTPIQCVGRVIRTATLKAGVHDIGIFFTEISPRERSLIDAHAEKFYSET